MNNELSSVVIKQLMVLSKAVADLTEQLSGGFYTIKEFCAQTGLKYKAVNDYCNRGEIEATQVKSGGSWLIRKSEVDRLKLNAIKNHYRDADNTAQRDKSILKHIGIL